MSTDKLNLMAPGEYIIREGSADPIVHPKNLKLAITLPGLVEFCEKKKEHFSWDKSTLIIYPNDKKTLLICNEFEEYGQAQVTGSLTHAKLLTRWKINTGYKWSLKQLKDFLRFNRMYFVDRDIAMSIIKNLSQFSAKVTTEIENGNDLKGNKRVVFDQQVRHEIDLSFSISVPVFECMQKIEIPVEVNFDVEDNSPVFWMESIDLEEMEQSIWDEEINKVISSIQTQIAILIAG